MKLRHFWISKFDRWWSWSAYPPGAQPYACSAVNNDEGMWDTTKVTCPECSSSEIFKEFVIILELSDTGLAALDTLENNWVSYHERKK